jgi:hypothetical protein
VLGRQTACNGRRPPRQMGRPAAATRESPLQIERTGHQPELSPSSHAGGRTLAAGAVLVRDNCRSATESDTELTQVAGRTRAAIELGETSPRAHRSAQLPCQHTCVDCRDFSERTWECHLASSRVSLKGGGRRVEDGALSKAGDQFRVSPSLSDEHGELTEPAPERSCGASGKIENEDTPFRRP